MGSRREEERNEKIIRGLMKLPPNRRCINCNAMGPQYVCTNFWTFVCVNCSGIHREFTHRVKSVSMAKFTSQEVEALQNGGNQRARESYLRDWDLQRQRLPDNSNADKIREFIKHVYVERRYTGGNNPEKPPKDTQNMRMQEEETRRASSYHSYSQSPPYDYQYEDRRYGKHGAVLTRKPGSDRGLYEKKVSSLVYSPGRLSGRANEDRFANEGSAPRNSDYTVSSGGDLFRSGPQSPSFQKVDEISSPPEPLQGPSTRHVNRRISSTSFDGNSRREMNGIPHPQRTASLGSFGSFDSNSFSLQSSNSASMVDFFSEGDLTSGNHQEDFPSRPASAISAASNGFSGMELFKQQSAPEASFVNLVQATAVTPLDLFSSKMTDQAPVTVQNQPLEASSSLPLDSFAKLPQHYPDASLKKGIPEPSMSEGWATFDSPNPKPSFSSAESLGAINVGPVNHGTNPLPSSHPTLDWPTSHEPISQELPPSASYQSHGVLNNNQVPIASKTNESWNAFGGSIEQLPPAQSNQNQMQLLPQNSASHADHLWGFEITQGSHSISQISASSPGPPGDAMPPSIFVGSLQMAPVPHMSNTPAQVGATSYKSTNPFDIPYDSDLEQSNMFLDMSTLQAALPHAELSSTLLGVTSSWYAQNPMETFVPAAPQVGMAFIPGQVTNPPIPNVPAQGHVASVGGNPFA
ncbi:hypothetical protein MLD38_033236 [Melastoma candidum]|uniref:Uncharacterized protein n=1 Tax=Melastoma candidum TaxID=119954 RepID=A0ACB9M8Q9_9MYRT|nr:hypothetical protein MLD38_033236 [Melastoma candidum]